MARTDEDGSTFLRKRGFSKAETGKIIETVLAEEGHPASSVFDFDFDFDFVQGITAVARDKTHQDARLDFEARAKTLLDRSFRRLSGSVRTRLWEFAEVRFCGVALSPE